MSDVNEGANIEPRFDDDESARGTDRAFDVGNRAKAFVGEGLSRNSSPLSSLRISTQETSSDQIPARSRVSENFSLKFGA